MQEAINVTETAPIKESEL